MNGWIGVTDDSWKGVGPSELTDLVREGLPNRPHLSAGEDVKSFILAIASG